MAPPFGFTCSASSAMPSSRSTAMPWLAKASLSSITSKSVGLRPSRAQSFLRGRRRPDAHDARRDAGRGAAEDAGDRLSPYFRAASSEAMISAAAPSLTPEALPAVTVPSLRNGVGSLASCSSVVSARGCSSLSTTTGSPFRCGIVTGTISCASRPLACAAAAFCWLRSAKASWSSRRDVEVLGHVLAGLRHGIDAVLLLHQRIDEAPADGGVVDLGIAREGRLGLRHHEGRARHGFDAAGDHQLGLAGLDGAGGGDDRIHARAAQAVDGGARHRSWAGRPAAAPCARRCGCPRPPGWRSRRSRRRPPPSRASGLRSISAFSGTAPRSSARTLDSAPPKRPMGVRI